MSMKYNKLSLVLCLVGLVIASSSQVMANELTHDFLLETAATYQLELNLTSQEQSNPVLVSVYTDGEQGKRLTMARIFQGLPGELQSSIELQLHTPELAETASVSVRSDENIGFNLSRINGFDTGLQSVLPSLIVNERVYTGLVVDARGLNVQRGMSPQIWSENGNLIYGGVGADYEFIQSTGVISYGQALSPDLVSRVSILGRINYVAPLTVKATDVIGMWNTDVVIDQTSAAKILTAINTYDFLANCAVVVLID